MLHPTRNLRPTNGEGEHASVVGELRPRQTATGLTRGAGAFAKSARMRRSLTLLAAAGVLAAAPDAYAAKRRMIVCGAQDDALTARLHEELLAMGFETTRADGADGCSRSAVAQRIREARAHGATCTDGDATGIWIMEPTGMRLRDVVVARTNDEQQRDTAAVRVAEIARASLELVDAKAVAKPKTMTTPVVSTAPADRDRASATPSKDASRVPAFVAGAGMSSLIGVDANASALSAEAQIGVARWLAIAPRLDYPVGYHDIQPGSLEAQPGFTGVSAILPLTGPSAIVIPRLGAGVGAAWIRARSMPTSLQQFAPDGSFRVTQTSTGGSDTTWSPALYATAAVSMRIGGPVRLTVDGAFGTTVQRLVVRTQGVDRAYWGAPFGALAIRMEVLFR